MRDQADTLRKMMLTRGRITQRVQQEPPAPHIVTVSSGKGGVGKSCLVANLGALLARSGLRVLLVDGDLGLANLDILLGIQMQAVPATLEQVLEGTATIQEAVIGIEPNLWLLPSSSGLMDLRDKNAVIRNQVAGLLESCPWEMDVILVDTGAGIQNNVLSMHSPAWHSVVILTPEPTSVADAYGLIKLLRRQVGVSRFSLVVNQARDGKVGQQTFQKLKEVASRFIDVELEYLGHWEFDEKITQSVMKRKILLDSERGARSLPSLELLAKRLKSLRLGQIVVTRDSGRNRFPGRFQDEPARLAPGNGAGFWRTLLGEVKA